MSEGQTPEGAPRDTGIGRRFFVGTLYIGFGGWFGGIFRFAVGLGIARLLGPELLGLWAFVFSVNEFLNMIGAFSMGLALIQAPRTSKAYEDTAFAIAASLGVIGIAAAAIVAPLLWIHHSPLAGTFILLLGVSRLMLLVGAIPLAKLERSLRYDAVAGINLFAGVISGLLALFLAWRGAGAWALMVQDLFISFAILSLAIVASGYRPRLALDRAIASRLMAFGRPMFASRSLEIALERIDRLMIGAFMGDLRLGLYHQSRVLAEAGWFMGKPTSRLIFNLYARFQEDTARLSAAFGLINYFLVRAMFAGAVALIVFPEPTIRLLLGERWLDAAPVLGALGLYAALLPIFENVKQLLYGRGELGKSVQIRLLQLLLLGLGIGLAIVMDDLRIVAFFLTGAMFLGIALACFHNLDVVGSTLREGFLAPVASLVITTFAFDLQSVSAAISELPYYTLPVLPPLVYVSVLLMFERGRIVDRLDTLRRLIRRPAIPPEMPVDDSSA